jgi:hypothetical protein
MNNVALRLEREERFDAAQELLERAAESGSVIAMYNLGVLLDNLGRGEKARRWWEHPRTSATRTS